MDIVIKILLTCLVGIAHAVSEIAWPANTPPQIQSMLVTAMKTHDEHPALPYKFGGNSPEEGGMDCSGAVTFILKQGGITPPRTAAAQHEWLKKLLHLS
jgi:cell wall-associated NlpC family hydrolase